MSTQPRPRLTPQDFLAWERRQNTRHAFFDGEIIAPGVAGRSDAVRSSPHPTGLGASFEPSG